MIDPQLIARLRSLFGTYFHQDWDLEGSTASELLDKFVDENPRDSVDEVRSALVELVTLRLSEPQTKRVLVDAGLDYHPPSFGTTYRDFVGFALGRLEAASGPRG